MGMGRCNIILAGKFFPRGMLLPTSCKSEGHAAAALLCVILERILTGTLERHFQVLNVAVNVKYDAKSFTSVANCEAVVFVKSQRCARGAMARNTQFLGGGYRIILNPLLRIQFPL